MGLVLKDAHQKSEYLISAKIKSIFSILKELLRNRRFFVVEFSNIRRFDGVGESNLVKLKDADSLTSE